MQDLSYNKRQQKERPSIRQIAAQFLRTEQQTQMEPFLQYIEENKLPFSLARCNIRIQIQIQMCIPGGNRSRTSLYKRYLFRQGIYR